MRISRLALPLLVVLAVLPATAQAADPGRFLPGTCPTEGLDPDTLAALKNARCGFLEVPENRSKAVSPKIKTRVAIIPAISPSPNSDPVVYMEGGPGESAFSAIGLLVGGGLNRDRDLIVMTQRGAFLSEPYLPCPEVDRAFARVDLAWDSAAFGREIVSGASTCRDRLVADGNDLSAYNTLENAADFADLRNALQISRWNLYGASYGTHLAQTYQRLFPEGTRSIILDGVVPTDIVGQGWTWGSFRESIDSIFAACRAQPECNRRYPKLVDTFLRLVSRLEANPLVTRATPPGAKRSVKVVIDGGALVNMVVAIGRNVGEFPAAIDDLAKRRRGLFVDMRAAQSLVSENGQALGLTYSAVCSEWVPRDPFNLLEEGLISFPTWPRSVLAQAPQVPFLEDLCRSWNVPPSPASIRDVSRFDVPTLVLSGTFDGKTGASWGRYLAHALPNSLYVQVPGIGHFVLPQSACARQTVAQFLATPNALKNHCDPPPPPAPFK